MNSKDELQRVQNFNTGHPQNKLGPSFNTVIFVCIQPRHQHSCKLLCICFVGTHCIVVNQPFSCMCLLMCISSFHIHSERYHFSSTHMCLGFVPDKHSILTLAVRDRGTYTPYEHGNQPSRGSSHAKHGRRSSQMINICGSSGKLR